MTKSNHNIFAANERGEPVQEPVLINNRPVQPQDVAELHGTETDPIEEQWVDVQHAQRGLISKTHTLGAGDDVKAEIESNGGDIIDGGGETFEISSRIDVPADTTLRNITFTRPDGATNDLLWASNDNIDLFNVTFDINSANASTSPSGTAFLKFQSDGGVAVDTTITGATNVDTNAMVVWATMDIINPDWQFGTLGLGGTQVGDARIYGTQQSIIGGSINNANVIKWQGQDVTVVGTELKYCSRAVKLEDSAKDHLFDGVRLEDNTFGIYGTGFASGTPEEVCQFVGCQIQGSTKTGFFAQSGTYDGWIVFDECEWKRNGLNSNGSYNHVTLTTDGNFVIGIAQMTNQPANDAAYGVEVQAGVTDVTIKTNGNIPDSRFGTAFLNDSGTRTRVNGNVEISGPPTDSNYSTGDEGLTILDTSTSPPTEYRVLRDGTTTTLQ